MLVNAGYEQAFCTPHVWPGNAVESRDAVVRWTQALQTALQSASIALKLHPGSELNLHPKVMQTEPHRIISMAAADKFILVDMWADKLPEWFIPTIRWLQQLGLTVILAHPERMRAVQDDPGLADVFEKLGILLQGNLQCFADRPDSDTRRTAERYLHEGRYTFFGSDTHNPEGLRMRLLGLKNAIAVAGDEVIDRLTKQNPRMLLPT